jgi:5-methylcytosine-specific restriction endonuclease McrA
MDNYKGINIVWDEDHDERIYKAIDILLSRFDFLRQEFLNAIDSVGEREACLTITYYYDEDKEYFECVFDDWHNNIEVDNDYWNIEHISLHKTKPQEPKLKIPPRIISTQTRYEVCKRQKWKCNVCGERLKFHRSSEWNGELCHIDHIYPYSDAINYPRVVNKINESINLQALCEKCNLKKWKHK